jgi:hypothetical protein
VIEMPLERAQRLGRLLAAARVWRANLIPNTSTGLAGPTRVLLEAIEALDDREPCEHPREKRVFWPDGRQECGACGEPLVVYDRRPGRQESGASGDTVYETPDQEKT